MTELESESEPESEATLYERLGVSPGASAEALRAGYRRRARQLHPDVAGDGDTGEAMRSLNQAWAVLSDSGRRRRYDEELAGSASIGPPRSSSSPVDDSGVTTGTEIPPDARRRIPFLRPSVLILLALALIFLVTAYAGSWPGGGSSATTPGVAPATTPGGAPVTTQGGAPVTTPGGAPASTRVTSPPAPVDTAPGSSAIRPVGRCLSGSGTAQPATIVPCTSNHGQILAEVTAADQCPTGTVGHFWSLRPTVLCALPAAP